MPKRSLSGVKGLRKRHAPTCKNRTGQLTRCGCAWHGRYKRQQVGLSAWSGTEVDPRSLKAAEAVFARMRTAIDGKYFDKTREVEPLGADLRLCHYIDEWKTNYADSAGLEGEALTANSLPSMLNVLKTGTTADGLCIGTMTLETLAGSPDIIKNWLNGMRKGRIVPYRNGKGGRVVKWKAKTWNRYYELLRSILNEATKTKTNGVPRITTNPMADIKPLIVDTKPHHGRILEDVEQQLFAALPKLNAPLHQPNSRAKLTIKRADQIRARVAAGTQQKRVAKDYGVSQAVVCDIVAGRIWNREKLVSCTKGDEMYRRLVAAIDAGLRITEMMLIQIMHINWTPVWVTLKSGKKQKIYEITLPALNTKGGKRTGQQQTVAAASERFVRMLDQRRMQLKNNPEAYIFGTETGEKQKGFKKQILKLFKAAGLNYGRDKGLVWHTTRAEFISRLFEKGWDPIVIMEMARHASLDTTRGYATARNERKLQAFAGMHA